ncbi:MAG: TIGR04282 family arsenosugar biosynthesis glycosyltransferase [Sciscionella sp.]
MTAAVLVMAKAPRPGAVKTRLHPLLGPAGCARLQRLLIRHAVAVARELAPEDTWVAFDPPSDRERLAALLPAGVGLLPQRGADLGERLAAASEALLRRRPGPALVIGTDIPTLNAELLAKAAIELTGGRDVVFGPALDGGYYLVGLTRQLPDLFALPPHLWGGQTVLAASLAAAARAGLDVSLLPALRDLDTPTDARALLGDPLLPTDIAELLQAGTCG